MFPHVPMDLAFLWADKLAFWHADMILTREKMHIASDLFDSLVDGELAAVFSYGGLRTLFKRGEHRYWEVLGCVTKSASRDMFETGCGWWRHWARNHINAPIDDTLRAKRSEYCWDHGGGVLNWKRQHHGKVRRISEGFIKDGHFSITSQKNYKRATSKSEEMDLNFDLNEIARRFRIDDLL